MQTRPPRTEPGRRSGQDASRACASVCPHPRSARGRQHRTRGPMSSRRLGWGKAGPRARRSALLRPRAAPRSWRATIRARTPRPQLLPARALLAGRAAQSLRPESHQWCRPPRIRGQPRLSSPMTCRPTGGCAKRWCPHRSARPGRGTLRQGAGGFWRRHCRRSGGTGQSCRRSGGRQRLVTEPSASTPGGPPPPHRVHTHRASR